MNQPKSIPAQIALLIQNKNFQDALNLCRNHWNQLKHEPEFRSIYARTIYHAALKPSSSSSDLQTLIKSLKAILELTPPPDLLAFHSLRTLIKSPNHLFIFKQILMHLPHILNPQIFSSFLNTQHPNTPPHDNALKNLLLLYQLSKIFHSLGYHQAALATATLVSENFNPNNPDPHNIRFWALRIKLLSSFQLNPSLQMANNYENLLDQKKDWFLFHELAQMYFQLNLPDKSLLFALHALSNIKNIRNDIPLRYKTLLLLLNVVEKITPSLKSFKPAKLETIIYHLLSVAQIHDKIPHSLKNREHSPLTNSDHLIPELLDELRNLASDLNILVPPSLQPALPGTIHSWFPNTGFGFVLHNGQTYYFNKIHHLPNPSLIVKNAPCKFKLINSFDKKKNKPALKALLLEVYPLSEK